MKHSSCVAGTFLSFPNSDLLLLCRLSTTCSHVQPPRKDLAGAWPSSAWRQAFVCGQETKKKEKKTVTSVWRRGPSAVGGRFYVEEMEDDGEAGRFAEIQWRSTKHGRNNNLKSQENRHHGWLACSFSCFCDLLPPLPDLSTRTQQELGATGNFSAPSCLVIGMVLSIGYRYIIP
jgi:hypothetical protein